MLQETGLNVRVVLSRPYALGDSLLVTCMKADPFTSQVDFTEAAFSQAQLSEVVEEDMGSPEVAHSAQD